MPNSRWYTGSGIYRSVWLRVEEKKHILPYGVKITTLSYDPARIRVETTHLGENVQVEIFFREKEVAEGKGDRVELEIPDAKLWSDENPQLYECHVLLWEDVDGGSTKILSEAWETFGIRKIEWSSEGLLVNGKETLLRGGCLHHDHGILGAKCYEKSEFRRIRMLKEAGYNAIRSAHNPASEALLAACDHYGLYVIDEAWDMWYSHKNKHDYAGDFMENYRQDIKTMTERDYNHPCVIMYSIGNEISEPVEEKGLALEKEIIGYCQELDPDRAGTCGMNHAADTEEADKITSPALDLLDIAGYNYASGRYPLEGKAHPDRVIYGSETFPWDIYKNWEMVKAYPYLIGDFMWTAWDYLGEAGGSAWGYTQDANCFEKPYPWLLADMGAFDILGNENGEAGYAQVVWGIRRPPYLAVQPVNHPGMEPLKSAWR